jgi:hypothetical protein
MTTGENMTASSEPTSDRPPFFDHLAATVEELGRLRWMLGQVVTLADDTPGLTPTAGAGRPGTSVPRTWGIGEADHGAVVSMRPNY